MARTLPPNLVAFDVAQRTGWAAGRFNDQRPETGVWILPAKDGLDVVGARIMSLENELIPALDRWQPLYVVMAEPFPSRNMAETESGFGLQGLIRSECRRRSILILRQPESTVRKEILGRGHAPTDQMKRLVAQWCNHQGIAIADHNAGDAAVLWRWARDELVRQVRIR